MGSIMKYLCLDSSFRNRIINPNPADYVAQVAYGPGSALNAFQSQSPVANSFPTVVGQTQAGSTTTQIVLAANSSSIVNFYNGQYLQIGTQFSLVTAYNPTTQTATVQTAFSVAPPAGTTYYIRGALPTFSSNLVAGSTQLVLNLGLSASTVNEAYQGYYIYFTSGPNTGIAILIADYNGTTQVATLAKALPFVPGATDAYDILQFSGDSWSPLIYSGTTGFSQPTCYSVELCYLIVPNQVITSGYGGTLNNYPYLDLALFNEGNNHSDKVIYSNNPNEQSVLFRVPLGLNINTETFFTLKDSKCIQVVKLKLDQPLRFRITLPNGNPIVFATSDNVPPEVVNPLVQISATFACRRIDGSLSGSSDGHK